MANMVHGPIDKLSISSKLQEFTQVKGQLQANELGWINYIELGQLQLLTE